MEENLDEFDYMIINVEYFLNGSLNKVFYAVKETKDANDADFGITCIQPNSNNDTSTHNPFTDSHTILFTIPYMDASWGYAVQIGVSVANKYNGKIAIRNKDYGEWQDWNIIS